MMKDISKNVEHVKNEMTHAIDVAWESGNSDVKELQQKLFPKGRPTEEEFLTTLADLIKKEVYDK